MGLKSFIMMSFQITLTILNICEICQEIDTKFWLFSLMINVYHEEYISPTLKFDEWPHFKLLHIVVLLRDCH